MRWWCVLLGIAWWTSRAEGGVPFVAETIDDRVAIGYGVALGDVDGDGRTDILLADKSEFVWYENPGWERHVLAANLTEHDNVCIAARDLDGDGRVEVAVGGAWNPGDTETSGSVHYLVPPAGDRRERWSAIELVHEPVVHRMRWVRRGEGEYVLVVAPLHGRGNRGGEGAGVRLLAYPFPSDPRGSWKTELLDDTLHVTHNFDVASWLPGAAGLASEEIAYIGREGALRFYHDGSGWVRQELPGVEGGGEIRMGRLEGGEPFVATIEPFHGDRLVVYRYNRQEDFAAVPRLAERIVLDDDYAEGHAIAAGDLDSTAGDELVAGWRKRNRAGHVGVKMYWRPSPGAAWQSGWVDRDGMACEDLRLGDLDGDGRLDIVAAGRSTRNLKVYWNRPATP